MPLLIFLPNKRTVILITLGSLCLTVLITYTEMPGFVASSSAKSPLLHLVLLQNFARTDLLQQFFFSGLCSIFKCHFCSFRMIH